MRQMVTRHRKDGGLWHEARHRTTVEPFVRKAINDHADIGNIGVDRVGQVEPPRAQGVKAASLSEIDGCKSLRPTTARAEVANCGCGFSASPRARAMRLP
jgi:hypothetical protein